MARKIAATKKESGPAKGSPSATDNPKAGVKEIHDTGKMEEHLDMEEDFVEDDENDEVGEHIWVRHQNRGNNKPDIDKPPYN